MKSFLAPNAVAFISCTAARNLTVVNKCAFTIWYISACTCQVDEVRSDYDLTGMLYVAIEFVVGRRAHSSSNRTSQTRPAALLALTTLLAGFKNPTKACRSLSLTAG
ncbi:hypothetical protein L226DRAFT_394516 [Lentinus tigrinus ALCF2SS1-7]|uniref:uncharacterized protein n=1 Tax=Lentinus tigrinus ALCF2SS1-7 TaxID=1328758 RepID=UPI00116633DF|nr:hypothetical protein L226DRAFT_394516 [Lentinus tigrinus ALCF2SS1-7]